MSVIVWASDGSESAGQALPWAVEEARARDATLLALHVEEIVATRGGVQEIEGDETQRIAQLQEKTAAAAEAGVKCEVRVARQTIGGAAQAIADVAREEEAMMIVVGTRGMGPVKGLLVGSVTQRLLHIASCPVLVIPA